MAVGGVRPYAAPAGRVESREEAQQAGLAGAVGTDQPDHVARGDDQVEPLEEGAVAVLGAEVLGDEGGSHRSRA